MPLTIVLIIKLYNYRQEIVEAVELSSIDDKAE